MAALACSYDAGARTPGIVVIVGTTGVGKTKLGVELAKRLSGEVVNADVMQMYKGLSIATAKATHEEMDGVAHHLMSFLEPADHFSPHEFRRLADEKIAEIHARGRVPIVVGGSMYYVQGLLWDHLIDHRSAPSECVDSPANKQGAEIREIGIGLKTAAQSSFGVGSALSSSQREEPNAKWEELNAIDPDMAQQIHPNNHRKIQQSLRIYAASGVRHSELIRHQRARGGGVGGDTKKLRYRNCGMIWLRAETGVLNERLDRRVDTMMRNGLASEISDLQADMLRLNNMGDHGSEALFDPTRGVFQSIGFKEFDQYLAILTKQIGRTRGEKWIVYGEK